MRHPVGLATPDRAAAWGSPRRHRRPTLCSSAPGSSCGSPPGGGRRDDDPKPGGLWDTTFSDTDHAALINTAGNLVLLSKSKNSSAGRREFDEKKTTYLANRVSDFPRSVQVLDYPAWTADVIRERTEEFSALVLRNP